MNPLVSIIIPTYNRKEYLKQAIESALQQSYPNIEIVVSDDCSTDGTEELVKGFTNNYSNILYFRNQPNLGFAGNHQKAICEYAKGEYGFILGDDDYLINNDFIKFAMDLVSKNNFLVAVGSNYVKYDMKSNSYINSDLQMPTIFNYHYYLNNRMSSGKIDLFIGATLFNKKCAVSINPFSHRTHAADGEFIDKLTLTGDCGFMAMTSICYRIHDKNLSGKIYNNWEPVNELYEIPLRVLEFAKSKGIEAKELEEYRQTYINSISLNYVFYQIKLRKLSLSVLNELYTQLSAKQRLSFLFLLKLSKGIIRTVVKNKARL